MFTVMCVSLYCHWKLIIWPQLSRYNDIPEKWEAPTVQPFPERPNLQYFLMEPDAFDQYYVYNVNNHIEVWLNSNPQPTKLVEREVIQTIFFILVCNYLT